MVHHLCDVTQLVGEISAKKVAAGYEWNSTMNPVLFHPDSRYRKDMSKSKKVLTTNWSWLSAGHCSVCHPNSPDFILDLPEYCAFFTYTLLSGKVSK